jgi:ATP phosphoribosyltransferase
VADGLFDVGITGRDWIEERGSDVATMGVLRYSKVTEQPIRVVLAVPVESPVASVADLPATATGAGGALRVSTEYPELTRRYLESHGVNAEVSLSYGATEAKVPDIADCVVEITETGRALRAAGLKIVETLLVSHTELIANPTSAKDPEKNHAIKQLLTLLQGALEARGKVLVKLNVSAEQLPGVIEVLPSLRSPTVSELFGGGGYAVETVVPKSEINVLIPALKDRGAMDIIELSLSKIVH